MSMVLVGALAGAFVVGGGLGGAAAWGLHRRTNLSAGNLYLLVPVGGLGGGVAVAPRNGGWAVAAASLCAGSLVAAVRGRRLRLAALGAGGELREFERSRVMAWTALARPARGERASGRARGERTRIAGQGE